MKSRLARGTVLAVGMMLMPLLTAPVNAQATGPSIVAMTAGEEAEVCSGANASVTAAKNGVLRSEGTPPTTVFYKANDTTTAVSETLTCTAGEKAEKKEVTINVSPRSSRNSTSEFSEAAYPEAVKAMFLLFVLALVLESALTVAFNWRPFVEQFNSRAVKPVISFATALAIVYMFELDLMTTLAKLIQPKVPPLDDAGRWLTAMVIAGGSAGVNNLMVGLGIRQARTPETVVPKPPPGKGWISVSVVRTPEIQGPVTVGLGVVDGHGHVPVVASLSGSTRPKLRYFLRDGGRFPGSGGYAINKGDIVTVRVAALKRDGKTRVEHTWGPHAIAEGAIIDLTFTMSDGAATAPAGLIVQQAQNAP